jgi:hypothetical protein
MKLLMMACLVPALFAQRGPSRPAGPVRTPGRVSAPGPVARPVGGPGVAPRPVYVLGYYPNPFYYGDGYASAPAPVDYGPAPGYYDPNASYPSVNVTPSVIINPNYVPETANPVLRDYTYVPVPEAVPQEGSQNNATNPPSVYFLIAMKDHAIYPAIAYWVENDTLNYISQQGVRNQVSLDLVDREFSTQLNKERNIDFGLPPAK